MKWAVPPAGVILSTERYSSRSGLPQGPGGTIPPLSSLQLSNFMIVIRSPENHYYIREPMHKQVLITLEMGKGIIELVDKNALRTVNPADFNGNAFTRRYVNYSFD